MKVVVGGRGESRRAAKEANRRSCHISISVEEEKLICEYEKQMERSHCYVNANQQQSSRVLVHRSESEMRVRTHAHAEIVNIKTGNWRETRLALIVLVWFVYVSDLSVVATTSDSVHSLPATSASSSVSSLLASNSEPSQDAPGPSTTCPAVAPDSTQDSHSSITGPSNTTITVVEGEEKLSANDVMLLVSKISTL